MVYGSLEPFGSPVEDHRFEQLVSLLFQANTSANTPTPIFFDRRDVDEIVRDEWLERARNPHTIDHRIASFFEGLIARQSEANPSVE